MSASVTFPSSSSSWILLYCFPLYTSNLSLSLAALRLEGLPSLAAGLWAEPAGDGEVPARLAGAKVFWLSRTPPGLKSFYDDCRFSCWAEVAEAWDDLSPAPNAAEFLELSCIRFGFAVFLSWYSTLPSETILSLSNCWANLFYE